MLSRIGCFVLFGVVWLGCVGMPEDDERVSAVDEGLVEKGAAPATGVTILDQVPVRADYPAALEAVCHGNATCSGVTACTDWSDVYDCDGGTCRLTIECGECGPPVPFTRSGQAQPQFCTREPGFFQNREQFRACFHNDGSECLEFRKFQDLAYCGC